MRNVIGGLLIVLVLFRPTKAVAWSAGESVQSFGFSMFFAGLLYAGIVELDRRNGQGSAKSTCAGDQGCKDSEYRRQMYAAAGFAACGVVVVQLGRRIGGGSKSSSLTEPRYDLEVATLYSAQDRTHGLTLTKWF